MLSKLKVFRKPDFCRIWDLNQIINLCISIFIMNVFQLVLSLKYKMIEAYCFSVREMFDVFATILIQIF